VTQINKIRDVKGRSYNRQLKKYKKKCHLRSWQVTPCQPVWPSRKNGQMLYIYTLPRLTHEETENLNRRTTSNEIKSYQGKDQDWLPHCWILPNILRRTYTNLLKLFQTIEEEEILTNTFYETSINLIPKPNQDITKKENNKHIPLVKTDAKSSIKCHWSKSICCTLKGQFITSTGIHPRDVRIAW
jgi:hypothetical protein